VKQCAVTFSFESELHQEVKQTLMLSHICWKLLPATCMQAERVFWYGIHHLGRPN